MSTQAVVNIRNSKVVNLDKEPYDIYIGRANKKRNLKPSKWGNPFIIGRDGNRDEVIEKYEDYIRGRPDLLEQLPKLRGKKLGCYCAPKACHGDVLVRLIRNIEKEEQLTHIEDREETGEAEGEHK